MTNLVNLNMNDPTNERLTLIKKDVTINGKSVCITPRGGIGDTPSFFAVYHQKAGRYWNGDNWTEDTALLFDNIGVANHTGKDRADAYLQKLGAKPSFNVVVERWYTTRR